MRRRLVLITLALVGCGGDAPQLFVVERTGSLPAAALELTVYDDGGVRCGGKARESLPGDALLEARNLEVALSDRAPDAAADAPADSQLRYRVRLRSGGTLDFRDVDATADDRLARLQALVRRIATEVCGRPR